MSSANPNNGGLVVRIDVRQPIHPEAAVLPVLLHSQNNADQQLHHDCAGLLVVFTSAQTKQKQQEGSAQKVDSQAIINEATVILNTTDCVELVEYDAPVPVQLQAFAQQATCVRPTNQRWKSRRWPSLRMFLARPHAHLAEASKKQAGRTVDMTHT